jgi:hypothetical protein
VLLSYFFQCEWWPIGGIDSYEIERVDAEKAIAKFARYESRISADAAMKCVRQKIGELHF